MACCYGGRCLNLAFDLKPEKEVDGLTLHDGG